MKINEVVTLHPAAKAKSEYDMLLLAGDEKQDEIIAYIMDDRNAQARRIEMLRHLDTQLGDIAYHYGPEDLDDFMHNQGKTDPENWVDGDISPEEAEGFKKDLKLPPYHLSVVETEDDDKTPTGEYEICHRCGGEGCIECEEGLKDITGVHKALDFDDFTREK